MLISLNVLLTSLKRKLLLIEILDFQKNELKYIRGIKQLPLDYKKTELEYLYICDEFHPYISNNDNIEALVLCVSNKKSEKMEEKDTLFYCISELEKAFIVNELHDIFHRLENWERILDFDLMTDSGLDEMLNITEEIIGFPLILYDMALKVIASSRGIDFEDEIFGPIMEKGFLPSEVVFMFEKDNIFTELEKNGIAYAKYFSDEMFSEITMMIKVNEHTVAYIVILRIPVEDVEYAKELLSFLSTKISLYLERSQNNILGMRHMQDYLISDLFINDVINEKDLKERLEYIEMPFEGTFYLMRLMSISNYTMSIGHLIKVLESILKNSYIFSLDSKIYILFFLNNTERDEKTNSIFLLTLKTIKNELIHYKYVCGISRKFHSLMDIRCAVKQAETAIYLFEKFTKEMYLNVFCFYDKCVVEDFFKSCGESIDLLNYCNPIILKVIEHDKKNGSNLFILLKTFLNCSENLSQTAEKLNMHRNNVVYHLKKIKTLYGLNLLNYDEKFHIELSIKILDYISIF